MTDVKATLKISASSVQTYEQCPRRWYYRYIEKLYPKVPEEEWTQFGNFIHDVAEHFKGGTLEEFKALVAEILPNYAISPAYKPKVIPAIKNLYIYATQRFKNDDVIDRERKIEVPYKDQFILTGKLDILHVRNNDVTVIDWKSSKAEKDHAFQLAFYKILLELFDIIKVDVLNCEIVYLCAETQDNLLFVEKYKITKDEVEDAIRRIDSLICTYNHLGNVKEKWRMKTGPLCKFCDYFKANICEGKKE
jgi:CRISPR/Cas system-associated exonuclease Cas4 (RecB family)